VTGLIPNTKYFLRGYVTNVSGTYYEEVVEKITIPAFDNNTTTDVTESAESVFIETKLNGGSGVVILGSLVLLTGRGIVYGTSQNPTIPGGTNAPVVASKQDYTTTINGLVVGQKYYYRPYATNAAGTGYLGTTDLEFTTLVKVTLPTPEGSYVTYDSSNKKMIIGTTGNPITITNNGSSTILSYGLCFTTDGSNPTDQNPSLPATGTTANATSFFDSISVVTPASGQTTTYKVRAYVTNDGGTAYSKMITFTINASNNITSGPSFTA
jgi:hypothetical protein